jgi:hypothetical protein
MALPILRLNLAPRPSLWRQNHRALGWIGLGVGLAVLLGTLGFTLWRYHQADREGKEAVKLTTDAQRAAKTERDLLARLQEVDVAKEAPRWKLAERILQERSTPWSRLTAELEQSLVRDVRIKGLQRSRDNAGAVLLKLKGEAKTRPAEEGFVETLRKNASFSQVILERESERQGGGWDFEMSLPVSPLPPPFVLKNMMESPKASQSAPSVPATKVAAIRSKPVVANAPAPRTPNLPRVAAAPVPVIAPGGRTGLQGVRPMTPQDRTRVNREEREREMAERARRAAEDIKKKTPQKSETEEEEEK